MTRSGILPALCLLPALFCAGPISAQNADCSFWASELGDEWSGVTTDTVAFCLSSGMDVNDKSQGGHPVVSAAIYSDLSVFKALLDSGGDPNAHNSHSSAANAAMYNAAKDSNVRLQMLIDAGARFADVQLDKLLVAATVNDSIESMDMLLDLGADQYARSFGQTLLHFAVRQEDISAQVIKHLIAIGIPADARATTLMESGRYGPTPLMIAASKGHFKAAKALLEGGANANATARYDLTALHTAISAEGVDSVDKRLTVRALITGGADVNAISQLGETPIHLAIELFDAEDASGITRLLLQAGANPNTRDTKSNTPLHMAIFNENAELIELLLDWKASVNLRDADGLTPRDYAGLAFLEKEIDPDLNEAYWRIYDDPN